MYILYDFLQILFLVINEKIDPTVTVLHKQLMQLNIRKYLTDNFYISFYQLKK